MSEKNLIDWKKEMLVFAAAGLVRGVKPSMLVRGNSQEGAGVFQADQLSMNTFAPSFNAPLCRFCFECER